jgi:hypothetical protein
MNSIDNQRTSKSKRATIHPHKKIEEKERQLTVYCQRVSWSVEEWLPIIVAFVSTFCVGYLRVFRHTSIAFGTAIGLVLKFRHVRESNT